MDLSQQQPAGAPAGPPSGAGGLNPQALLAGLHSEHDQAHAQFQKLDQSKGTLEKVRVELDGLAKLGDSVTPEDVISAGGGLVTAGLSPKAVAALLATMPPGGEALASWVQQHDQQVQQLEAQNQEAHAAARHQMGVAALHVLAAHQHFGPQGQGRGDGPSAGAPNPLMSPTSGSQGPGPSNPLTLGAPNA